MGRTFAIGDIHGEFDALERLLGRLPDPGADDTIVFLGDYLDRGPSSREVVARVRALADSGPHRTVALRGNHEDKWLACTRAPDPTFLCPPQNGCGATYRSLTGGAPLAAGEELSFDEMAALLAVEKWMPPEILAWIHTLPFWYEDEHAIYVHAGLDGEGTEWKHPRDGRPKPLLWMREPDFFAGYAGKRLIFGHTCSGDLPGGNGQGIWERGDLIGIDTCAGKGGFLSAIELPSLRIYDSR